MISLLDGESQYVLAEATKKTSLRADSPLNKDSDLYVGMSQLPRRWALCDKVLDPVALADGDKGIFIIPDLSQSEEYEHRTYVKEGPQFRFCAVVPIISPNKTIVGSVCILDGAARSGMCEEDILYMKDLASTVMDYLTTYTLREQHRQAADGLRGLISFAEGDSTLQSYDEDEHLAYPSSEAPSNTTEAEDIHAYQEPEAKVSVQGGLAEPSIARHPSRRESPRRSNSIGDLQDMVLPNTTKNLFARAANIMQASRDMDGVMFLDASVSATGFTAGDVSSTGMR
jgi:GAF domain-containing protein